MQPAVIDRVTAKTTIRRIELWCRRDGGKASKEDLQIATNARLSLGQVTQRVYESCVFVQQMVERDVRAFAAMISRVR